MKKQVEASRSSRSNNRATAWSPAVVVFVLAGFLFIAGASPAVGFDKYGAIAYSASEGAWGYSYNYDPQGAAEQRALAECSARGRGCQVAAWFRNACGALATASNGSWGRRGGRTGGARRIKLSVCAASTGEPTAR